MKSDIKAESSSSNNIYHEGAIIYWARKKTNTSREFIKTVNQAEFLYQSSIEEKKVFIKNQIEVLIMEIEKTLIGEWWLLTGAFDIDLSEDNKSQNGVKDLNAIEEEDPIIEFIRAIEASRGYQFAEEQLIKFLEIYDLLKYLRFYDITLSKPLARKDFIKLFQREHDAKTVEDRLELSDFTFRGVWQKNPGECASLYKALIPILKPGDKTTRGRAFVSHFGVNVSDRTLTEEAETTAYTEFKRQFEGLLTKN